MNNNKKEREKKYIKPIPAKSEHLNLIKGKQTKLRDIFKTTEIYSSKIAMSQKTNAEETSQIKGG